MDDPTLTFREAVAADEPVLWCFLAYAASMPPPLDAAISEAQRDRHLCSYVVGWGRTGDLGVIAERAGAPVGAAWLRLGEAGSRFAVGDEATPELATGVNPAERGKGTGTALLERLIALATPRYPAIVLSVREENPAARLYRRMGFVELRRAVNRVGGESIVMRRALDR